MSVENSCTGSVSATRGTRIDTKENSRTAFCRGATLFAVHTQHILSVALEDAPLLCFAINRKGAARLQIRDNVCKRKRSRTLSSEVRIFSRLEIVPKHIQGNLCKPYVLERKLHYVAPETAPLITRLSNRQALVIVRGVRVGVVNGTIPRESTHIFSISGMALVIQVITGLGCGKVRRRICLSTDSWRSCGGILRRRRAGHTGGPTRRGAYSGLRSRLP